MWPCQVPVLLSGGLPPTALAQNFLLSEALDPRWNFARNTGATRFNASGVNETVGSNVLRVDYDPSTLSTRGFLREEARTNAIPNNTIVGAVAGTPGMLPNSWYGSIGADAGLSVNISSLSTYKGLNTITFNVTGSNNGSQAGNLLYFNLWESASAAAGETWTGSCFVAIPTGSVSPLVLYSFAAREYDSVSGLLRQNFKDLKSLTSSVSYMTNTVVCGTAIAFIIVGIRAEYSTSISSIAFSTLVCGMQLEKGAFPTSVIPTSSAAASRSADVLSCTGAAFSALGLGPSGTILTDVVTPYVAGSASLDNGIWLSDGTANNRIGWARSSAIATPKFEIIEGGNTRGTFNGNTVVAGVRRRTALTWDGTSMLGAMDGQIVGSASLSALPAVNRLYVCGPTGGVAGVSQIRGIQLWPKKLNAAQLCAVSRL